MRSPTVTRRRALLAGLAAAPALLAFGRGGGADPLPRMTVAKDPSCGCCGAWVEHIRAAGFPVEVNETEDLSRLKARLGVPRALASCHTAEIGGYVVEGHVPAAAIRRLLAERPAARGLAVAGMPTGSPGMEVAGAAPVSYDVLLFGPAGTRVFARYRGAHPV